MSDEDSGDGERDRGSGDDVDPVTLEVLRNACSAVAEEMNATLLRTAYSPNVTDRRDCSCALFDPAGELVSQAENIPVHLGAMPFSVAAAIEAYPPPTLEPGDAIALNDPYSGGAHLPDVTIVTPVFESDVRAARLDDSRSGDRTDDRGANDRRANDEVIALAANRAHHADVGGASAGSLGADATDVYAEGLRLPPVKLVDSGEFDDDLLATILANVRTPEERRGDLRAQVAANEVGRERVADLVAEHGHERFTAAVAAIQDYSERRVRTAIADLPDGEYAFADALDDDGHGTEDVRIEATVTVDGEELSVDFAGSAPQTAGPLNAVRAVTVSATYFAVRCVTDPDVPPNAGAYRPITVETPSGSVVDASPPSAVAGGNVEVSQRIADVVFGALAAAAPERAIAAGQGTMNNVTIGGTDPRGQQGSPAAETDQTGAGAPDANGEPHHDNTATARNAAAPDANGEPHHDNTAAARNAAAPDANGEPHHDNTAAARNAAAPDANGEPSGSPFAFYETQAGGAGGRNGADGMDAVHVHMTNTQNTSAEVLEIAYPLAVERYALRPDSGGAGEFRGGLGVRRDLRIRTDDATLSLLCERRRRAPYGIEGGGDGATGEDVLVRDGEEIALPSKCTRDLERGDVVSVRTPGGGGYGDPNDREEAAVRRDVRLGKLSREAARSVYGVELD